MKKEYMLLIFLTALIAGFFVYVSIPGFFGSPVLLKLMPVDPFDLIRGQYLTLNYEISSADEQEDVESEIVKEVFVVLAPDRDGVYNKKRVSSNKNDYFLSEDEKLIRGLVKNGRLEFGIEELFMEKGARLNERLTDVYAKVLLTKNGRAQLIGLVKKDGTPVEFEYSDRKGIQR